jgi:hypothetical protein
MYHTERRIKMSLLVLAGLWLLDTPIKAILQLALIGWWAKSVFRSKPRW